MSIFKLEFVVVSRIISAEMIGIQGPGLVDGTNTGDIIRWNAVTGVWEKASEPFEFIGYMKKSVYDADLDGIVDEAEAIDGGTW